jgi:hypothetical protein
MKSNGSLRTQVKIPIVKYRGFFTFIVTIFFLMNCSNDVANMNDDNLVSDKPVANVISVSVKGNPNAYTFSVEIQSPDTGCNQYADWWEVLSEEGALIYRRILTHSHVNEQPFIRSGSPVPIEANHVVYIRGHMHPGGYGGNVLKGSVIDGFQNTSVRSDFASEVENEDPQPDDCAF